MKFLQSILALLCTTLCTRAELNVFAASSTTDAMKELAVAYKDAYGESIRFNFASSGTLARQINEGAPADCFISANEKWMNWLDTKESIKKESRFDLAANTLVMVTPPNSKLKFDGKVDGHVAVGNFNSVPAGIYAKESLEHMGWLHDWKPHIVQASNARTALLYVQRGEVDAGLVYATDAKAAGLPILGTFPEESHSPIVYPAAACSEKESALQFLVFLKSDKAKAILKKHGFTESDG